MHVLVLNNPVAGRGRSGAVADGVRDALVAGGIHAKRAHTPAQADDPALLRALQDASAAIVVGGDGALRRVAPALMAARTPVYNVPGGTENLFARQFGMTPTPADVVGAVERMCVQEVDVGSCAGEPFLLMCGTGADAAIVHRLTRHRSGAITHASYARHVLAEFVRGRSPRLTIRADGRTLVDDRSGAAIFANSRQYALRIDPEPRASMDDGMLDLVFFPSGTSAGALLWNVASRLRAVGGDLGRRHRTIIAPAPESSRRFHASPSN